MDIERNIIVVLDDSEKVGEIHERVLRKLLGTVGDYDVVTFSSDRQATEFVHNHHRNILGYIQDINRIEGDTYKQCGLHFLNNVISSITPWARCIVVSATPSIRIINELYKSNNYEVEFISKLEYSEDALKKVLLWLLAGREETEQEIQSEDSLYPLIQLIEDPWAEILKSIAKDNKLLHEIPADVFEALIAEIFKSHGWLVELTAATRDGGHDIIAVKRNIPSNLKLLIEAKRYRPDRAVSVDIVRSLYGVKALNGASQVILATSSYVSSVAKKEFKRVTPWELDFLEREKILSWCKENGGLDIPSEQSGQIKTNNIIQPTQKSLRAFWSADY